MVRTGSQTLTSWKSCPYLNSKRYCPGMQLWAPDALLQNLETAAWFQKRHARYELHESPTQNEYRMRTGLIRHASWVGACDHLYCVHYVRCGKSCLLRNNFKTMDNPSCLLGDVVGLWKQDRTALVRTLPLQKRSRLPTNNSMLWKYRTQSKRVTSILTRLLLTLLTGPLELKPW